MKLLLEPLGELWCRMMHREVMWPIHGRYQCRVCFREFLVPYAVRCYPVWREEPLPAVVVLRRRDADRAVA